MFLRLVSGVGGSVRRVCDELPLRARFLERAEHGVEAFPASL